MLKPALSLDELRTLVVQIVGQIKMGCDVADAEEALQGALTCAYQAGKIEAQSEQIERNALALARR